MFGEEKKNNGRVSSTKIQNKIYYSKHILTVLKLSVVFLTNKAHAIHCIIYIYMYTYY